LNKRNKKKGGFRRTLAKFYRFTTTWTGAIIIVLFVISFVVQSFVIPSSSMVGTLLIGDYLFVKKYSYGIPTPHFPWIEIPMIPMVGLKLFDGAKPQRGDIVVFRKPGQEKVHFVKRCVAVGDDMVMLINKNLYIRPHEGDKFIEEHYPKEKIVKINDKNWIENPYQEEHKGIHHVSRIINDGSNPPQLFYFAPVRIKKNEYFMMGDNRDLSNDSRFWGSVPYENIEGTPWLIYFSINHNTLNIRWDRMFKTVKTLEKSF
jgi:signal peptidase I